MYILKRLRRNFAPRAACDRRAKPGQLLPCDIRHPAHTARHVTRKYGSDQSGGVTYAFNSLGYRGDDYNADAAIRICITGESNAIGVGVPYEATFGDRFRRHLAEALSLDPADVNLVNLAMSGSSGDYCVRSVIRQLSVIDVDLVICQWPTPSRVEYFDGEGLRSLAVNGIDPDRLDEAPAQVLGYIDFFNAEIGRTNLVKNALLFQSWLDSVGNVPHLSASAFLSRTMFKEVSGVEFSGALDFSRIVMSRFLHARLDRGVDGSHAGPKSHGALAVALLERYGRLLTRASDRRGPRVSAHAAALRQSDPDWLFCHRQLAQRSTEGAVNCGGVDEC